jgi:hypothetical protein
MSESSGRKRRRKLVAQLREEGRRAFRAGVNLQQNPHKYADAGQWSTGWLEAQDDAEREQAARDNTPSPLSDMSPEDELHRLRVQLLRAREELRELRTKYHTLEGAHARQQVEIARLEQIIKNR